MRRHVSAVICLSVIFSTVLTSAQLSPTRFNIKSGAQGVSSAVAYVYVSTTSRNKDEVKIFSASSDGSLRLISSPASVGTFSFMAVNSGYLFGSNGALIDSFSIAANGKLTEDSSVNVQEMNGNCGGSGAVFLDRMGSTLYDLDFGADSCSNNAYQFFSADGNLNYLGVTSDSSNWWFTPLSFSGNNQYAYGADCLSDMYWDITGFQRNADGSLTDLDQSFPMPKAQKNNFFCPFLTTTDQSNHVVISMQEVGPYLQTHGEPQLATYTIGADGTLTTKSNFWNMATTVVDNVTDLKMSPSGELVAVSGTAGLEVFHFNGAKPLTSYTGLLATDVIVQVAWDNDNHLYAIGQDRKLYVFTITPTSVTQAPGSPHTIATPQSIAVLPKT